VEILDRTVSNTLNTRRELTVSMISCTYQNLSSTFVSLSKTIWYLYDIM